jgi:hypothetical protein
VISIFVSNYAIAAAQRSLDSGWRLSRTASGPQLHGLLGSTVLRPMPPHYSRDLGHGPGAGSGHLPRLPSPTCSRLASGVGLGRFCMGFFHCGLPAPALPLFSLCALRLFITKQMFLFLVLPSRQGTVDALTQAVCIKKQHHAGAMVLETNLMHDRPPLNQFIRKSPLSS